MSTHANECDGFLGNETENHDVISQAGEQHIGGNESLEGLNNHRLGSFFEPSKRRGKLRVNRPGQKKHIESKNASDPEASDHIDTCDTSSEASESSDTSGLEGRITLGPLFDAPKRKRRLRLASSRSVSDVDKGDSKDNLDTRMHASVESGIPDNAVKLAAAAVVKGGAEESREEQVRAALTTIWPPQNRHLSFGPSPRGGSPVSKAASCARSRAAWKKRADTSTAGATTAAPVDEQSSGGDAHGVDTGELPLEEELQERSRADRGRDGEKRKSSSHFAAASMYRPVHRAAVDSTRCHWLLAPESLLIRVDPETSEFLQRQWLALASIKRHETRTPRRPVRARSRRETLPARLHQGWLAQHLRPSGWLSSLPEHEERHLPMPVGLIGDPILPQSSVAAMERVILRELGGQRTNVQ